jgi:hypothetical protein
MPKLNNVIDYNSKQDDEGNYRQTCLIDFPVTDWSDNIQISLHKPETAIQKRPRPDFINIRKVEIGDGLWTWQITSNLPCQEIKPSGQGQSAKKLGNQK